jgi:hypothetical protein
MKRKKYILVFTFGLIACTQGYKLSKDEPVSIVVMPRTSYTFLVNEVYHDQDCSVNIENQCTLSTDFVFDQQMNARCIKQSVNFNNCSDLPRDVHQALNNNQLAIGVTKKINALSQATEYEAKMNVTQGAQVIRTVDSLDDLNNLGEQGVVVQSL